MNGDLGCYSGHQSVLLGLRGVVDPSTSLGASVFGSGPDIVLHAEQMEQIPAEMALSTLYLHELHHRQVKIVLKNFFLISFFYLVILFLRGLTY